MPKLPTSRPPKWPRLKWLRPPLLPLAYLLFAALPLSIWASPGADPTAAVTFAVSLGLLILVATTASRGRATATLSWARVYFALGTALAWADTRFDANELAGIMLLFLPLAAALALAPSVARVHRLQTGLLALLFAGTLLATGSRGGLLALAVTAAILLALERRWLLLALALVLAAGLAAVGPIDRLLYDGKVQGLTLDSLLTGRPEIWRRSLHAVADFSWTGIGIGTFPEIVPALYYPPGTRRLDHAHSLVLQTALDLGVLGLLAAATLVWYAFWRVLATRARAPRGQPRRAWALGLLGSLTAFTFFNLADAVPLGSLGSLPFFILLGLIYALPVPRVRRRRWRLPARGRRRLLIGAVFLALGLTSIRGARTLNHAAVAGARAVLHDPAGLPAAHASLAAARQATCRAGWLEGKVAQAWGRPDLRDRAWSALLRCDAGFVPLIEDELPEHRSLAEQAVGAWPESATAHFWLARVRARAGETAAAVTLYRRGLDLAPTGGLAWYELGRLLAPGDPTAALDAFARACRHGDPGANACRAAGQTAERLGDHDAAIGYYRQSRLRSARARADELEEER